MTKQSAGTASRARFAGFQQQLIVALCGAALAAFGVQRSSAQVAFDDFNSIEANSSTLTSTGCGVPKGSSAPAGVLFCLNYTTAASYTDGFSFIDDSSYNSSIDPDESSTTNSALQFTGLTQDQTSTLWYSIPQNVANGFDVWFAAKLTFASVGTNPNFNNCCTADGFAFVIQNAAGGATDQTTGSVETGAGLNVVGGSGGGIGYDSIDNSVALELDTFYDSGWDPSDNGSNDDNHMALQSCGAGLPNSPTHLTTPNCLILLGTQPSQTSTLVSNPASSATGTEVTLADGNPHQVVMTYNGPNDSPQNYIYVYLDPSFNPGTHTPVAGSTPIFSGPFNIANYINLLNGGPNNSASYAYIGFTSSNGFNFEQSELMGFSFAPHYSTANVCQPGQTTPAPCSATIPVNFSVSSQITSVQVVTQGVTGLDFKTATNGDSCSGLSSGSCTVNVTFAPLATGLRTGAVELLNGSTIVQTQPISGIGEAPVATLSPEPANAIYGPNNLSNPVGVTVDAAGNTYVANLLDNNVLKISPGGGTATPLGSGLNFPESVAVDGAGDIFIGQLGPSVTEIPASCAQLTQQAQSGCQVYWGALNNAAYVALDAQGDLFIGDPANKEVVEDPANGGPQVTLYNPQNGFVPGGMAVDLAGDVFVTDTGNHQVLELPTGGGSPIPVASGWSNPQAVALDAAGDLYVTDPGLDAGAGEIVEIPAGCTQAECQIVQVTGTPSYGIALDPAGDIYFTDTTNGYLDEAAQQVISLGFPGLNVGTACCGTSFTFGNVGNEPLTAVNPGFAVTDANFSTTGSCNSSFSLAPGADCSLTVAFAPEVAGPAPNGTLYGSIFFRDNALNNPNSVQSISVAGNSTAAGVMFPLTVTVAGAGNGSVVDNFTVISCNYSSPNTTGTCSGSYEAGALVTLTASAGSGSTFVSWGGACAGAGTNPTCVVTMNQALNVSASFANGGFATANVCPGGEGTGPCSSTMTVTFNFPSPPTPGEAKALTEGVLTNEFQPNSSNCAGDICTVIVTFTPQAPGLRLGAVELFDSGNNLLATQMIYGIGEAPEIAFGPAVTYTPPLSTPGNIVFSNQVTSLINPASASGMTTDESGNLYLVTGTNLLELNPPYNGDPITAASGFVNAVGVAIDGAGNLYVADSTATNPLGGHGEVLKLAPGCNSASCGTAVYSSPAPNPGPVGVAVDGLGDIFVADNPLGVFEVQPSGNQITLYKPGGNSAPQGVAVDAAGDVFIADDGVDEVVELPAGCTSAGCQIQVGSGWVDPRGVAVDAADDAIVADFAFTVDGQDDAGALEEVPTGCTSGSCQMTLFTAGASDPAYVTVSATGQIFTATDGPVYEIDQSQPPQVNFGSVNEGLNAVQTFTLQNIGNEALNSGASPSVNVTGPTFLLYTSGGGPIADCTSGPTFTLQAGQTCEVGIIFEPSTSGPLSSTAVIVDNSLNTVSATQVVNLSGTGVGSSGGTNALSVSLLGSGSGTVSDGASLSCSPTNLSGCSTAYPTSTPSVTLTESASAGSVFLGWGGACAGAGTSPQCVVTLTATTNVTTSFSQQSFGTANICESGQNPTPPCSQNVALTYNISTTTAVGGIQVVTQGVTGLDFSLGSGSTCIGTITGGSACNVNVTFTPLAPGLRMGAVNLFDNSGNLIESTPIYGVGQAPEAAFGPGTQTTLASGLAGTSGVAVDAAGDVFVSDNAGVVRITPTGVQSTLPTSGLSASVYDVAVDGAGDVFLADAGKSQVVKVTPAGVQTTVPANGLNSPTGVAVDGAGDVFITDTNNNRVVEVTPSGVQTTVPTNGVRSPYYPAVDAAGDVFFLDAGNERVLEVTPGGVQSTVPISGLRAGNGVAVDAAGDVYVSDQTLNQIFEVTPSGATTTVPTFGLNIPAGLAVDGAGDVFIAVNGLSQVFEISRSQVPSFKFALTSEGATSADSPQAVLVQNVGNRPLSVSVSPTSSANFVESQGSTCGSASLTPGGICSEGFSFTPQSTGYLTDAAYFSDNSLNLASSVVAQAANLSGVANIAGQAATVIVPNVVGMTQVNGTAAVTGAGLALGAVSSAYSSGEPAGSVIGENPPAGQSVAPGSPVELLISIGEAPPPTPNPLTFENNYFVTGDYASAGVGLRSGATVVNGMASASITLPSGTGAGAVPTGADIIDAFLYWQTIENTSTPSANIGTFLGYPITGQQIGNDIPYTDASTGLTGTLRAYRADVNTYFPITSSGVRLASGGFPISFPDGGSALPLTQGASLVVIYRALVAPGSTNPPSLPLKSVVIYDGSTVSAGTTQNMLGFYDSAGGGESTALYSAGTSWSNNSGSVTLGSGASQYSAPLNSGNAYVAEILSTPVVNSDNDGILDSWKAGPPQGDFFYKQPGYYEVKTQSWVPLPGAKTGQQDLFVQLDYMCGAVLSSGACDPTQEDLFPSPDSNGNDPLAMVQQAFLATGKNGIHLHLQIGNAVPETTCTDSSSALCQFPGEPGVIGWKDSLEFSKIWPRNFTSCAAGGDCTARFPYGQKDSYHYVLFGHSLAIPAWNSRYGSLASIAVSGSTTTIVTSDRGNGINACPSRITISGVLSNPGLNGVYNTASCPDTQTMIVATPSGAINPWTYTYSTNTPPEPVIGITSGTVTSISGYSDLGGADSAVTLALWETAPNQDMSKRAQVIAGTLFHEIGHTLGLSHGGLYYNPGSYVPSFDVNCKPNYQSVMNYLFQLDGLGPNNAVAFSNQTLEADSSGTIGALNDGSLGPVTSLTDASGNPATFPTTAWYVDPYPTGATTASAATLHCDGTPLGSDSGYRVDGSIDGSVAGSPGWTNGENIAFDGVSYTALAGYNDWNNIDLRQVGATGGEFASLASVLSFGSSATPLNVAAGGNVTLGSGGTVALGSGGTVTVGGNSNVTLGSAGTITSSGGVTLNNGGTATLSTGGTVTVGNSGGTVTLGSGGTIALGSGGTVNYPNSPDGGSVGLPSGGTVTLGSGGTITSDAGTVSIPSTGGTYTIDGAGGTIVLGSGGNVTLGSGGNITLGSGGTIALGSGGNVTLGSGGTIALGSGGTIALGSGGTIALGSGGNVTLGSGGTIALGSGGNVTLGSGGNVTLGSGGNVTLGSGGNVTLGSGGNVTLGSGGTVALGSGGNVTLGSGGNITLGSGGTIALGSGGTVTSISGTVTSSSGGTYTVTAGTYNLSSGGNITLGSGGNVTLGSGGNVTLGSGGVVALGSGGNVTLGSGGTIALGSGGNVTLGSGGVTTNEMDYATANSVVRPPPSATYTQSSNGITVNWMPPVFGVVQSYTVYLSQNGGTPVAFTPSITGINGNPPQTSFTDTTSHTGNGTLVYTITTTLVPDTNGPRQSLPSPPAVLTLNQTIVLGSLPGSVNLPGPQTVTATSMTNNNPNGLLVSFSASGPCSVGSSSLNAQTLVSSATVTLSNTGNCTITASQAGDVGSSQSGQTPYNAAQPVSATFAIVAQNSNATPQTINFPPLPNVPYGSTFTPNASSNYGQQITYTTSGPCNANGTISGIGICKVTASAPASAQGANPSYNMATASQSFTVQKAVLTVTAGNLTSPSGQIPSLTSDYAITGYVNSESSSVLSGAPTLSTTATSTSSPAIYPINISAGTLTAANYSFQFVPGTLTIQAASQSALVLTAALSLTYNQSESLNVSGGSTSGALTYNVTGNSGGSCSAASGQLTAHSGTGSCTVSVTMAGNSTYNPVTSNSVTVNLQPANQATLTLGAASPLIYNQSETLSVSGGTDNGSITYTATGSTGVICSIASGKLSANSGTGSCTVSATMAGNNNYNPVTSNSMIVTLQPASQTIGFTTPPPGSAANGVSFTVAATASSGLAVTLTSAGGCTNSTTTLISGAYTSTYAMTSSTTACSVIATAASSSNYASATVTKTVTAASGPVITVSPTSLTFGPEAVGSVTTQTVTVSNTGSATATISTPVISVLKAGNSDEFVVVNLCSSSLAAGKSCTITVSFVAGAYYSGAQTAILKVMDNAPNSPQQVSLSGTILEPQTITFTSVPSSAVYNSSFTVTATGGGSGNPVTFTASGACSVPSGSAKFTMTSGTGTCSVIANQAGNSTWAPASQVTKSVSATLATPTISINNLPANAVYGSKYTATYTYTGNGTPSVTSSTTSVCTASGSSVSFVGLGTCTLKASATATTDYAAVTGSAQSFTVGKATQTISLTNVPSSAAYKSSFTVTATASSGLAVAYTSSGGCSNSGATYTMNSGTAACSIIVNQPGNSDYSAAPQVTGSVTATVATQTITFTTKAPATAAYKTSFTVAAKGGSSGNPVTFNSSGSCSNSGATYTITSGTGTCTVIANQAGTTNEYSAASTVTETVSATFATASLTPTSLSFGAVASGKSSTKSITLENTGTTSLIISSIGFTGSYSSDFTQTNNCPSSTSSLAAGASCTISVTFKPNGNTSVTENLTITDNTSAGTQSDSLTGS